MWSTPEGDEGEMLLDGPGTIGVDSIIEFEL